MPFARTLLSYLPGQTVVKPVADFVFRGLGLSSAKLDTTDGNVTDILVSLTGCGALVRLYVSDLLSGSREVVRYTSQQKIETTVSAVRLHVLRVCVINPTPSGTRQGQWCAAFVPEQDEQTEIFPKERRLPMQFRDICQLPGAVIGPASRTLTVTHRFRPTSGDRCAFSLGPGQSFGWLVITFEDLNRETYHEFKPSEFQCSVELSGQMTAYHSFGNNLVSSFSDTVQDYLKGDDFYSVKSTVDNAYYRLTPKTKSKDGNSYKVTGAASIAGAPGTQPKPDLKLAHQLDYVL